MRYEFVLVGTTPLLMHNDDIEWADELESWRKDPKNKNVTRAGDDRSPAWAWMGNLYHDGESLAVPSDNLSACLRQAGARVKLGGRKTLKEGAVSGILLEQEFLPLAIGKALIPITAVSGLKDELEFTEHLAAVRKVGFSLFTKRAKIGASKHIRVRPRFDQWSVSGSLEVMVPEITRELLEALFHEAGKVGLGDWRPGCKTPGRFGMFEARVKAAK